MLPRHSLTRKVHSVNQTLWQEWKLCLCIAWFLVQVDDSDVFTPEPWQTADRASDLRICFGRTNLLRALPLTTWILQTFRSEWFNPNGLAAVPEPTCQPVCMPLLWTHLNLRGLVHRILPILKALLTSWSQVWSHGSHSTWTTQGIHDSHYHSDNTTV